MTLGMLLTNNLTKCLGHLAEKTIVAGSQWIDVTFGMLLTKNCQMLIVVEHNMQAELLKGSCPSNNFFPFGGPSDSKRLSVDVTALAPAYVVQRAPLLPLFSAH